MELSVDIDEDGPLFRHAELVVIPEFLRDAENEIGEMGVQVITHELYKVIRDPTPYYWTRTRKYRRGGDIVIDDARIVYGPWLEGTSEKNRTTRFKGYATYYRMSFVIQNNVSVVANGLFKRHYLWRLQ